tara:strand:+ start:76339 stop:77028 length:690 start_codon:yes stop_codon:yes gene_type:complete
MDRFKITGDKLVGFYGSETKLMQVFKDIELDLKATNQVVCQYIINGKEVSEVEESSFQDMNLTDIQTLEYLSENINELLIDVLAGWLDAFPEMIGHTEKISSQIRFDGVQKSFKNIQVLLENYEYLISSIISIKSLVGDSAAAGLAMLSEAEEKTKTTLSEAITAIEKKDFVCLADIVEYELITSLQIWEKLLSDLLIVLKGEKSVEHLSRNSGLKIISNFSAGGRLAN